MEVYLDHAATTPVDPEVLKDMMPYFTEEFANANSQHHFARKPQAAMDRARQQTAEALGCKPNEVYFTGSGSEANTWALKGIAFARQERGEAYTYILNRASVRDEQRGVAEQEWF